MFVVLEGVDGTGKTTQAKLFIERLLRDRIYDDPAEILTWKDPGSTILGEEIRNLLLNKVKRENMNELSEALLFFSSRASLPIQESLESQPSSNGGYGIVMDRYYPSTFVYQNELVDYPGLFDQLVENCCVEPDLIFVLDSRNHKKVNAEDNFEITSESQRLEYRERYVDFVKKYPENSVLIDANGPIESVHEAIWSTATSKLRELQ